MSTPITGIVSDYDGTLCPTSYVRSQVNTIPEDLDQILWDISREIPVCIISSKDFHFLHTKTRFARILSCIMGIETVTLKTHDREKQKIEKTEARTGGREDLLYDCNSSSSDCIEKCHLSPNDMRGFQANSNLLSKIAEDVTSSFKNSLIVERKLTKDRRLIAGITFDYRHLRDWRSRKKELEPRLKELVKEYQPTSAARPPKLHFQTYSSHPFLDLYAVYCNKGMAFDYVSSRISNEKGLMDQGLMYLGDSENDNPAFERADVSIGVVSDDRLKPKLSCSDMLNFDSLPQFLKRLKINGFVFSHKLLDSR